jgi:hypothetical protein
MRAGGRGALLGGLCLLMSVATASLTGMGVAHADVMATTVAASLSDGTNTGTSLTEQAGTPVTETAVLSGDNSGTATGTVTYTVYSDAACTMPVPGESSTQTVTAGTAPASAPVTLDIPGTYYWQAAYSGDANNAASVSACGDEVETVAPAGTTVNTSLSGGGQTGTAISVPAGTVVTDTASLAGANAASATGSVTYTVYSDSLCRTEMSTQAEQITTPGMLPSAQVMLPNTGTYYWQAAYSGDAYNAASVSACGQSGEIETVTQAPTTAMNSVSGDGQTGAAITVPAGSAVTDTATLSGTDAFQATGSITYGVYSNSACTTAVSTQKPEPIMTAGILPPSAPETLTIAGTYYWQATYSGDANDVAYKTPCSSAGGVEMVTPMQQPASLTTELSGGGHIGTAISVPTDTAVTDTASLSGIDASVATGWVTYTVYANSACTTAVFTGTPEQITTRGTPPASASVSLSTPGTYYWQASYSGDANNAAAKSACGTSGDIETVTPAPTATTLTTSLLSAAKSGTSITVQAGTPVRDSAHLAGINAAKATGTVTYKVYSNAACSTLVAAGSVTVTGGVVPSSPAESLIKPGTYYWTAAYSGDSGNKPSASRCGAQTQIVTPAPVVATVSSARATRTASVTVSTTTAGDLLVAFVSGRGPAGKSQSASVSGGLKWTLAGRENTGRGDAEVWDARAGGMLHKLRVTATQRYSGSTVTFTVVAFVNAAGIGRHATFHSGAGAPIGTLATSKNDSLVFAVGDDWLNSAARTPGAGQAIYYQSTDSAHDTYWVQATKSVAASAGTRVTINDTRPARDPYNLVLAEILWG